MKTIIFLLAILATQLNAQTYTFNRIAEAEHYMAYTLPISDTIQSGSIVFDGATLTITTGESNQVIEPVKLMMLDEETGLQAYGDQNGTMYFLDLEHERFIIVRSRSRTTYDLVFGL